MPDYSFGPYKNSNVRLSTYGIAVQGKDGKFVSYDCANQRLIDVDVLNIPIDTSKIFFKIPKAIKDVEPGDIIIHNNTILIVEENLSNKFLVINPYEGTEQTVLPLTNFYHYDYIMCIKNLLEDLPQADSSNPFGSLLLFMLNSDNNNGLLLTMLYNNEDIDPMLLAALGGTDISPYLIMSMAKKKSKREVMRERTNKINEIIRHSREDLDE